MKKLFPSRKAAGALAAAFLFTVLPFASAAHAAATAEYLGRTPPRLSLIDGEVSYFPRGQDDWQKAELNTPMAPGDYLATGPDSRAELQVGAQAFVRLAPEAELGIDEHQVGLLRIEIIEGRVTVDARSVGRRQIEFQTPHAKLAITKPGLFDIEVSADDSRFTVVDGDEAIVTSRTDRATVGAGTQIIASESGLGRDAALPRDDWLRWNSERTDHILAATSRRYVSEDVYGSYDLDDYGSWREEPTYGRIWVPSRVASDWAPYTTGRWVWDVDYGWTWVDVEPWGYAPYHYGRWVRVNSYWAWAPGPIVARPVYSPALVAFFGGGRTQVSVSVGTPFVSWVALSWGEPVIPWWGPPRYRGRPCWDGWGGPTIINNVYVDRRRVTVREINHYHNQRFNEAIVSVSRHDFGGRRIDRVRERDVHVKDLRPVRQGLPVQPRETGVREVTRTRTKVERPPRPEQVLRDRPARGEEIRAARRRGERDEGRAQFGRRPDDGRSEQERPGADGGRERARENDGREDRSREQTERDNQRGERHTGAAPNEPRERADRPERPGAAPDGRGDNANERERRARPDGRASEATGRERLGDLHREPPQRPGQTREERADDRGRDNREQRVRPGEVRAPEQADPRRAERAAPERPEEPGGAAGKQQERERAERRSQPPDRPDRVRPEQQRAPRAEPQAQERPEQEQGRQRDRQERERTDQQRVEQQREMRERAARQSAEDARRSQDRNERQQRDQQQQRNQREQLDRQREMQDRSRQQQIDQQRRMQERSQRDRIDQQRQFEERAARREEDQRRQVQERAARQQQEQQRQMQERAARQRVDQQRQTQERAQRQQIDQQRQLQERAARQQVDQQRQRQRQQSVAREQQRQAQERARPAPAPQQPRNVPPPARSQDRGERSRGNPHERTH